eukprot:TRINITY_DN460_c0_g1_i1.p3 TRINITY_DN460_c0_g1~~TRINITY_DN460_c0_g1_i1.p3  ORF type:complete len:69 (-),score=30.52 TRINITY_DN460_c0_g1_i1:63-269(-)
MSDVDKRIEEEKALADEFDRATAEVIAKNDSKVASKLQRQYEIEAEKERKRQEELDAELARKLQSEDK